MVLGVSVNRQDSVPEISQYAHEHGFEFPVLKDVGNEVADSFEVVCTPDAYLPDAERRMGYWS